MYIYNTFQGYAPNVTKTIVPGVSTSYEKYGAVWSTVRKSVLFYGGKANRTIPVGLMEYQPSNNQWTNVVSFTEGPATDIFRSITRVVSADILTENSRSYHPGRLMFGNQILPYSVFILDVNTLVWTKGTDPKIGEERYSPACAVVGDYFIVAGGSPPPSGGIVQPVIVYNIKMNQWTDSYKAPNTPSVSTGIESSSMKETASPVVDQGQPSGTGNLSGAKIGIIAGGSSTLLIFLTCGAFLIHRRKMRKSQQADSSKDRPQQSAVLNKAFQDAPPSSPDGHLRRQGARNPQYHSFKASSPSLHGHLRPRTARNPQHHSSSIPTVAVLQWQCTQPGQNPQHIPPPPTKPTFIHYLRYDTHDGDGSYPDRLDNRTYYHDQRRNDSEYDLDCYNHAADYSAVYRNRYPNNRQPSHGDYDDEDYFSEYQDLRVKAPQGYDHSLTENDVPFSDIQRRLDPQDHTRRSTASQLEFYQIQPCNNPQDHGYQICSVDDILIKI
ncbi:hypothetical protein BGZ75_002919 [Mortierella antarctica]|nr:hypothetical protein BGZ75_002919 [Mortierella antarctica]